MDANAGAARRERRIRQRQDREEANRQARIVYSRRERNKRYLNVAIVFVVAVLALWGLIRLLAPAGPGEHDALAQCLTEKGVIMYGTDWCPHCQEQKRRFGESFRLVTFVNCDANAAACDGAGVKGYPTWVFPDGGASLEGEQTLESIATRAGCPIGDATP